MQTGKLTNSELNEKLEKAVTMLTS
jgi:hypothetical protein